MSVKQRGSKWWVMFRYKGQRIAKPSPINTKADAKDYEALLRQKLINGDLQETKPKKQFNYAEFAKEWMDTYVKSNNKESEYINKSSMLKKHILPFFGKIPLDKITNFDIEKFKVIKQTEGLSNKTINNSLIALNKSFHSAMDWEILDKIPKIKLLNVEPQKFDFLSQSELRQLLDKTTGDIHDMILITSKTGMRHGELTALAWSDICLKPGNEQITIQKSVYRGKITSPKSNKIRHIPLTKEVIEMLKNRQNKTGLLFPSSRSTPLVPYLTRRRLREACTEAEIRQIGWHTLRHTFASHLVQGGVPIYTVKDLLGHSEIAITQRYAHLGQSDTRNAISTLESIDYKPTTRSVIIKVPSLLREQK